MFTDNSPFNEHGDVLNANPTDESSINSLIEEIKNRAKALFAAKNFIAAEALYSKAINTKKDPTLLSNRSAVRISLGKFETALEDAQDAINMDPTFPKAFYRKGQACLKIGPIRASEALNAFKEGKKLDPKNKAWDPLIEKADTMLVSKKISTTVSPKQVNKSQAIIKPKGKPESEKEETNLDFKAEELRGYKKTADGRITTYFNRDLSEEEKNLIGNIAPKKIHVSDQNSIQNLSSRGESAWNTAGTWEEKNVTSWAKDRLEELIKNIKIVLPKGTLAIKELNISGDASITFSRGKRRYLYEFSIKFDWEIKIEESIFEGSVDVPDMGYDCEGDYEIIIRTKNSTTKSSQDIVNLFIKNDKEGLKPTLMEAFAQFVKELSSK